MGLKTISKQNQEYKLDLYQKLSIVSYFEEEEIRIQLVASGNDHFRLQAKIDLKDIRKAMGSNTVKRPWRSQDNLALDKLHEIHKKDLKSLLRAKFQIARELYGFKTIDAYARHEAKDIKLRWSKQFVWFPILEQWVEYLENLDPKTITSLKDVGREVMYRSFTDYLNDKTKPHFRKIEIAFKSSGKGTKSIVEHYVLFLISLEEQQPLKVKIKDRPVSEVHRLMKSAFGYVGSPQQLRTSLRKVPEYLNVNNEKMERLKKKKEELKAQIQKIIDSGEAK